MPRKLHKTLVYIMYKLIGHHSVHCTMYIVTSLIRYLGQYDTNDIAAFYQSI